jgi:hypothetical protein
MDSTGITILGSIQVDRASMSVELSNLDGVLLRKAHTRVHSDDVLREMFGEPSLDHVAQLDELLTAQEAETAPRFFALWDEYISGLGSPQLREIEPMPSRRVLTESESKQLRHTLAARWGVNGYWYPLSQPDSGINVIAFHQELWEQRNGTGILLRALEDRAIEKCFALLEGPSDYELDRALVDPTYQGDEIYITSDFEWLIYSSHESSIAVAGWLADLFKSQWPDWRRITYEGPFHTVDMRGTLRTV